MAVPVISATTASTEFDASFSAAKATDRTPNNYWVATTSTGWLRVQYASAFVARAYYVAPSYAEPNRAPQAWTFEGSNNGTTWTVLDTRTSQTAWVSPQQVRYFSFSNSTAYTYYRLNVSANNGDGLLAVAELWVSDVVAAGSGGYATSVLADSPSAFYRWSETSGAMAEDFSGNHRSPVELAGGYTRNATSLVGDSDPGVALATNGYGRVVVDTGLSFASGMSVDAVIRLTSRADYSAIFSWDNGGTIRNVIFRVDPTGALTLVWWTAANAGPNTLSSAANTINTGTTYHVAVTHDGTNVKLYVDGTQVASTAVSGGVRSTGINGAACLIGAQFGPAFHFNGTIDELAIYPAALTSTRVAAHYAAISVATSSPVSVTAPALALTAAVPAPTVSAASRVSVLAPVLAASMALLAPTVNVARPVDVAAPTLSVAVAVPAPTVTAGGSVSVVAPVLGLATAVPTPTVNVATTGVNVSAPKLGLRTAVLAPLVDTGVEATTTAYDFVDLEDLLFVQLTPAAEIDVSVPILSEKHPSPVLSPIQQTHQAWVDYTPTTSVVGYAHIWVGEQDITYFRGAPTLVRNWTKEAPWGDKTAMWEMPQLDPWDVPGEGDLAFLRKDAPVVIGIVDDVTGTVTRKWSGFYHARRKGFDTAEDYVFEAHGTMWAAMFQAIDPVPYQPPVDIGILIPRLLNKLIGRHFHDIPQHLTGLMTRYRGARDEKVWQSVQNILARDGWTVDGRQWTLKQVADDEYRLVLKKPMSEIAGTVAWGNPGVDFDLSVDEDSRVDAVFCRWVVPGGGSSANVKYPGLELLNGLPYPNADAGRFLNLGTNDADTTSGTGVTDWQNKARSQGFTKKRSTGVMTADWVDVVRDVQDALDITIDGSIGPQTWTATFTTVDESIDLTPRRLPMAFKSTTWPTKDGVNGQILGKNPAFDTTLVPRFDYLDMGTNITRPQVASNARTYLKVHGEAVVTGTARFRGCLDNLARTDLDVGDNFQVRGFEGANRVVQVGRLSVDLDASEGAYVVSVDADEQARDALTIDQILQRNRDALPDPARRPGSPNRSSRNVADEGFSWDIDSPCGKLVRTPVNGDTGLWTRKVIPFAEIGQLAGIRLHSTVPFAMMIMASLRFTENMARSIVGNPFANTDPYRPKWTQLEKFGILGAWGAKDDACGYSPGQESDGYAFTGDFIEGTTLEYVTETPPYVAVLLFARGDSGFVWGDDDDEGFLPATQT